MAVSRKYISGHKTGELFNIGNRRIDEYFMATVIGLLDTCRSEVNAISHSTNGRINHA